MRAKFLLLGIFIFLTNSVLCQENKIDLSSHYVFNDFISLKECDASGKETGDTIQMPINAIYKITGKKGKNYIIQFLRWKLNKENIKNNLSFYYKPINDNKEKEKNEEERFDFNTEKFNLVSGKLDDSESIKSQKLSESTEENTIDVTERFFLIEQNTILLNSIKYEFKKYEFVFGTITYLARIRPTTKGISGNWSTDLNLGIAYGIKKNLNNNWGVALLGGLSISKIKIDSLSTQPSINETIEKVSLSPTVNFLLNYKNFYIGLGVGFDWINHDTEESKRWVYNKKSFYAIGIGINLFSSSNSNAPTTTN